MKRLVLVAPLALLAGCTESSLPPTTPNIAASATASAQPRLAFFKSGGASIGWSTVGGSSPGDASNNVSIQIVTVGSTGSSDAGAYTYGRDEAANTIVGRKLSAIDHLGFDSKGYLGVRISLGTTGTDGEHTYFLQASSCNVSIGNGWFTSDFINGGPTCFVFRDNDPTGRPWTLWVPVATANNEVVASSPSDWFLIVDQGPTLTYVDRLTIQDWCWTGGGNGGIINANSGDCVGN